MDDMYEENKIVNVIKLSHNVLLIRELYEDEEGEVYYETHTLQVDNDMYVTELKFINKEFSLETLHEAVKEWENFNESLDDNLN